MATKETIRVKGFREFLKACQHAPKDTKRFVREAFRQVGEQVRSDAADRFKTIDARSAAGYKTRVRQRGVAVEQSIRKTTGLHPEYGSLQMRRALIPALQSNAEATERATAEAMEKVADHFERTSQP